MKFAGYFTGGLIDGIMRPGKAYVPKAATPTSINTAGAVTYTIAQLMTGIIVRDPNGAARTDVLPTAALIVAGVPGLKVGDIIRCKLVNGADAAEAITLTAGTGGAFDANQTATSASLPQNTSKDVMIRMTAVGAAPTYVAYV